MNSASRQLKIGESDTVPWALSILIIDDYVQELSRIGALPASVIISRNIGGQDFDITVHPVDVETERARLDLGEVQQVVHQQANAIRLLVDDAAGLARVAGKTVHERL